MDGRTRNDVIDNVISQSSSLNTMRPVTAYDDSDQRKPEEDRRSNTRHPHILNMLNGV